jgi:hypothetical protein
MRKLINWYGAISLSSYSAEHGTEESVVSVLTAEENLVKGYGEGPTRALQRDSYQGRRCGDHGDLHSKPLK